jgi:3-phosphoshikimate 1-carboxyvinyltransferase
VSVRFSPAGPLRGTVQPPPDKSISHRAALLGAMSAEPVRVRNYLDAEDTRSTLAAVRSLGALIESRSGDLLVRGVGLRDALPLEEPIDVGNAGTLMRLLPGWLAGQRANAWTLDGDASIRRRPVDRVAEPLRRMGASIDAREGRFPPMTVRAAPRLRAIEYELPVASAQVKSCVLLAGVVADGDTAVLEPAPSRDHTERMLLGAGVPVRRDGRRVTVACQDELEIEEVVVPGDLSSAAFLVAAGVLVRGSRLVVAGVNVNWTRTGFLRILERMGAVVLGDLEPVDAELTGTEPVSDLDVTAGPLVGTVVEPEEVPLAIDELPLVALLGCFAEGETIVRGAGELRLKESDRIATVVGALRDLGAEVEGTEDGFVVHGTGRLRGGRIHSHGDHRLAMLGAVAGLASEEGVEVEGMEAAAVSYPGFAAELRTLVEGGARRAAERSLRPGSRRPR